MTPAPFLPVALRDATTRDTYRTILKERLEENADALLEALEAFREVDARHFAAIERADLTQSIQEEYAAARATRDLAAELVGHARRSQRYFEAQAMEALAQTPLPVERLAEPAGASAPRVDVQAQHTAEEV